MYHAGPRAILDAGFALGLLGMVLLLSGGLASDRSWGCLYLFLMDGE